MKKSAALFFLCLTFARCVFADDATVAQINTNVDRIKTSIDAIRSILPDIYDVLENPQDGTNHYLFQIDLELDNIRAIITNDFTSIERRLNDTYYMFWSMLTGRDYNAYDSLPAGATSLKEIGNYLYNLSSWVPDIWIELTNIEYRLSSTLGQDSLFETNVIDYLELNSQQQENIYNWLTGLDRIGGTNSVSYAYTFPEWLDMILTNTTSSISWDQITNFFANVEKMGWDGYQVQNLLLGYNFPEVLEALNDYNLWGGVEFNYMMASDFNQAFADYNEFATDRSNFISRIVKNQAYANMINSMSMFNSFSLYDWLYNFTMPIQTNQSNIATALFTGDIQDKYSYLTNWYSNLADSNFNMPYTERLELLLAALVFAGDGGSDTNQTSFSDAETNAEDIKTQYVSLVNQLNQTILGDVKSNIERTDRSLLSFFQSLDSALSFQYQPNIHIEHNVDSNFGTDSLPNGFGIGDYWEFDLESNGVDTFIKFCRACTSIIILSGWLFIVWQLGRGTAKICWRMAVLAFKTCSKLLG